MIIDRKKNAIKGTIAGLGVKCINIIFPFILRTIFIYSIGIEYLGLNSLFSSVLQVLNLSELGIGSAIIFSMYKPIAEDDEEKICQLMNMYKYYYRIVGVCVLVLGLCIMPFLSHIVSGSIPSDINLYVIYLMNLSASVLSYWLFAYRNSLFTAFQRMDIQSFIGIVITLIKYCLQIISLILYKNYYLYLLSEIISVILINIVVAFCSKHFYPNYEPRGELPKEEQKVIGKRIMDLFTARLGGVVNHSADTIVISAFIGLKVLAEYQNYYYIISTVMAVFFIFFGACTAGIGNSLVVDSKDKNKELFYNINYIVFGFLNFSCAALLCTLQPFMKLWVGEELMLDFGIVVLLVIYLYAEQAPRTMLAFKDAGGIWHEDKFRPLTVSIVNLFTNILLVKKIGLYGILISTIVAMLIVGFPWLTFNINKTLFKIDLKRFVFAIGKYTAVIIANSAISFGFCSLFDIKNQVCTIFFRLLLCGANSFFSFWLFFRNTSENRYFTKIVLDFFKRKELGRK